MDRTVGVAVALVKAAESLLGRKLEMPEQTALIAIFTEETGTDKERALKSIRRFANLTDDQLQIKIGSSDDTNRKFEDLKKVLEAWKRST